MKHQLAGCWGSWQFPIVLRHRPDLHIQVEDFTCLRHDDTSATLCYLVFLLFLVIPSPLGGRSRSKWNVGPDIYPLFTLQKETEMNSVFRVLRVSNMQIQIKQRCSQDL